MLETRPRENWVARQAYVGRCCTRERKKFGCGKVGRNWALDDELSLGPMKTRCWLQQVGAGSTREMYGLSLTEA